MQETEIIRLSNGMSCAFMYSNTPVAYISLTALAGTRYEPAHLAGLAHLAEHMLFKGTRKRSAYHINNRLERLGGELNAFTTKEELVVQATVMKEDFAKALELIADIVFHSVVPQKELEKEKAVVADEIASYKDTPGEWIFDQFEEAIFAGSPLATSILGTERSLRSITDQDLRDYYARVFTPSRMVLAVVGKLTVNKVRCWADKFFGQVPCEASSAMAELPSLSAKKISVPPFYLKKKHNTHQIHCMVGVPAYGFYEPRRVALGLLVNVLGGPASNARLNMILREQHGLVYTVEGIYTLYSDAGFAGVYFGTDASKLDRCLSLLHQTLDSACRDSFAAAALERAKKQYMGQMVLAEANPEVKCLSIGKTLLFYHRIVSHEEAVERIKVLQPADLAAAAQLFAAPLRSTLIFY